ncbi:helix-turn-helix domain-containing protein [Gluconacetobacter azotocaptans]|uniref:Helix-turn-helix domain-containing protein n=1 Tax=Gluconacetobacter azotocaptans TaxID=142834 RepID=A0A7W4PFC5_9PROT|nr:helix-turn-helix domain-containing protein [Gluconacetobacter azotocaptans]MBB2190454.1 helix-turn-helix domain-containing protein [Gluconacetobacter azotocaptans]MBM9400509.1 helix-turn-helix domain-containing protein [Gluconacetobacter azotocaptans]GBQ26508.1 putative transcriptional regulator [Gluconacetobacter azotocaptans DSM 13594]
MSGYKIGELAERTRTTASTIRYYEQIGLLRRPDRQEGNQRRYGEDDVARLTFIRRGRAFGFSIEQVRTLASLVQDRSRSCMEARDIAQAHLADVRAKLRELKALEKSIAVFVAACDSECAGGPGPDCVILDDLSVSGPADRSGCCKAPSA